MVDLAVPENKISYETIKKNKTLSSFIEEKREEDEEE
jgi:hypothetical protein